MKPLSLSKLSSRERALVLVGLAATLLALFFLWLRANQALESSHGALQTAQRTAERQVTDETRALRKSVAAVSIDSVADARTYLLDGLSRQGLTLSRLDGGDTGKLTLEFEDAEPSLLFIWLDDADRNAGLVPSLARLDARDDGRVRAAFTFKVTSHEN